jgi:signal transduction histidine kinase
LYGVSRFLRSTFGRCSEAPANLPAKDYRFFVFASYFYLFSLAVHGLFIPFFALLGIWPLAIFNVVSVLVYIIARRLNRRGRLGTAFFFSLTEILLHTLVSAYAVGNSVLLHVPMLLGLFVYVSTFERRGTKVALAALIALAYAAANYGAQVYLPTVILHPHALTLLNLVMSCGAVLGASYMGYYYTAAAARAEEALRQRTVDLQARNEELDAFAHTVAHDLKGPLSGLMATAEVLEALGGALTPDEHRDQMHALVQSGRKMSNIIDELLLLASVRRMNDVSMHALDMAAIVNSVLQRMSTLPERQAAEIVLPVSWPAALGHAPWVEEVWANYLSNALRYGGQPPHVELGAEELAGGWVRFWVHDNGPGIQPEQQVRLFVPFTRLDHGHANGHGLGLSIVQRIIERMGGQVAVESGPGQGSVFSFTLPLAQ